MIIKPLKLKQHFTRNNYKKALAGFFKPKTPSKNSSIQPSYQTFLNETAINSKTNSFSFLTSNLNSFEQSNKNYNLPSLNPIKEETKFNILNEYSKCQLKQSPTTSISNNNYRITNKNEDSFFSRHSSNSRMKHQALKFPKRIFYYHDKTQSHDNNLFNKRYLENDPNENYVRNSFKLKQLVSNRTFVNRIRGDLTTLKYSNKIRIIVS